MTCFRKFVTVLTFFTSSYKDQIGLENLQEWIFISVKYMELALLLILALLSDIKTYKIKNIIVFPFILCGLITNLYLSGLKGLYLSLLGTVIPVFLLIILFALRMLGAGDIKLFSAVGAVMGAEFVLYSAAYSFLCGGVIALAIMIFRKNGRKRLQHLANYLKTCLLTYSLQPYTDFGDKKDGGKFHFSYAIVCGVAVRLVLGL